MVVPNLRRVDIDMDDDRLPLQRLGAGHRPVPHPGPHNQQQVALPHQPVGQGGTGLSHHAKVAGVGGGQHPQPHQRTHRRQFQLFTQAADPLLCGGGLGAAPHTEQRPPGLPQGRRHPLDLHRMPLELGLIPPDGDLLGILELQQLLLHIHGDIQQHRPGAAGGGDIERLL